MFSPFNLVEGSEVIACISSRVTEIDVSHAAELDCSAPQKVRVKSNVWGVFHV